MQTLTERVFDLTPPGGIFDDSVVSNLFPGSTAGVRKQAITQAEQGETVSFKDIRRDVCGGGVPLITSS